ncbi:hypothetical protein [Leptospira sarikeiensis]|uniref:Membrane-binding protein n=1 Tax=Leptospira sarikeiensis TaxID=2484943 RepID=A0A4R9K8M8_9LEPT|nr:hypothetical protein [Leptospira sarikeiensis]TGL62967.1 hypothetical protein EHQ64_07270 [Leptospira sarikeiensis]
MKQKAILISASVLLVVLVGAVYWFFFKGKCEGNCRNGFGSMTYWDGKKYVGQWKDGDPDGFGILVDKDRKVLFSGRWIDGKEGPKESLNKNRTK